MRDRRLPSPSGGDRIDGGNGVSAGGGMADTPASNPEKISIGPAQDGIPGLAFDY